MIKIYFIRNTISRLLIYSVHRLGYRAEVSRKNLKLKKKINNDFRGGRGFRDRLTQSSNFTVEETEAERG